MPFRPGDAIWCQVDSRENTAAKFAGVVKETSDIEPKYRVAPVGNTEPAVWVASKYVTSRPAAWVSPVPGYEVRFVHEARLKIFSGLQLSELIRVLTEIKADIGSHAVVNFPLEINMTIVGKDATP